MKLKICGIQSGPCSSGMTGEQYVEKQIRLLEETVEKETAKDGIRPYLCSFPEAMTNAYFCGVKYSRYFELAEDALTGPTTVRMTMVAKELGIHLAYSFFEKCNKFGVMHYYSSVGLVSPTRGMIGLYRKTHLPNNSIPGVYCYETYYFEPGMKLPVFVLDNGVTIGILLCFDRSFSPAWHTLYLQNASIILVPSCTWGFRYDMFQTELRVRALETHSFVMALNRAGIEKLENENQERNHFGHSMIAGPMGDMIMSLGNQPWAGISAVIDLDEIDNANSLVDIKGARRPELYGAVTAAGSFGGPYIPRYNS